MFERKCIRQHEHGYESLSNACVVRAHRVGVGHYLNPNPNADRLASLRMRPSLVRFIVVVILPSQPPCSASLWFIPSVHCAVCSSMVLKNYMHNGMRWNTVSLLSSRFVLHMHSHSPFSIFNSEHQSVPTVTHVRVGQNMPLCLFIDT